MRKSELFYNRSGFTTAELIIAILVIAIISAASVSVFNTSLIRANVNQTSTAMEILAAELEDVLADTAQFSLNDDESIEDFLYELSERSSIDFDSTSIDKKSNGFTVMTTRYADGFGQPYKAFFAEDLNRVIFMSSGKNVKFQDEADYINGNFDDDIVMLLEFK